MKAPHYGYIAVFIPESSGSEARAVTQDATGGSPGNSIFSSTIKASLNRLALFSLSGRGLRWTGDASLPWRKVPVPSMITKGRLKNLVISRGQRIEAMDGQDEDTAAVARCLDDFSRTRKWRM